MSKIIIKDEVNREKLRKARRESYEGLQKDVARIILQKSDGYDRLEDFFKDLFEYGCVSGLIDELIYYVDTHKFAQKHIEDIIELLEEETENQGEPIKMEGDYLNWLAWFGFEETARKIYHDLGGEEY